MLPSTNMQDAINEQPADVRGKMIALLELAITIDSKRPHLAGSRLYEDGRGCESRSGRPRNVRPRG